MSVHTCEQVQQIAAKLRRELVKVLLRQCKHRCPATGERINLKNCVVLVDDNRDPWMVCSQSAWAKQTPENIEWLASLGLTVDERTVQ